MVVTIEDREIIVM